MLQVKVFLQYYILAYGITTIGKNTRNKLDLDVKKEVLLLSLLLLLLLYIFH